MGTTIESGINKAAAERILVHDDEAKKAGFSETTPWFAIGTRLIEAGREKFRQSRAAYEDMPEVGEALPQFIVAIQAENRIDLDVTPDQLEMLDDGMLKITSPLTSKPIALTDTAFRQLARWLTDPRAIRNPAAYFADIEVDRRARYVNDEIKRSERSFKLRTRTPNGTPEVYAVTGTGYTPVDADQIALKVMKGVTPTTKCNVLYQGTQSKIDLVYHANLPAEDVAVGEYYKASQSFRSNDDGTAAISGGSSLFRGICINLTTVEVAQSVLRRRHTGNREVILAMLDQALVVSYGKIKYFVETFELQGKQDVRKLVEARTGRQFKLDTPKPIFQSLFDKENRSWAITGLAPEAVAEACDQAFFAESEDWSVRGFSNAISRAAHEGAWRDLSHEQALQDRAGQLIVAKAVPWDFVEQPAKGE